MQYTLEELNQIIEDRSQYFPVTKDHMKEVLFFILHFSQVHHQRVPTYRDICEHMNGSTSQVTTWIEHLEEIHLLGFEQMKNSKSRYYYINFVLG